MLLITLIILFILASFPVNAIQFVIHVDNSGKATFFGKGNASSILPEGVNITSGNARGETYVLTNKAGKLWTFSFNYPDSEMQVYLPIGANVKSTNGEVSLSNKNIVIYGIDNVIVSYTIEPVNSQPNYSLILIIILALALVVLAYFYTIKIVRKNKITKPKTQKSRKSNADKLEIIKEVLNDKEKSIIDTLKSRGVLKSNYLRRQTNISKSSFFRHLQELEKKKIIQRFGEGRNKNVKLIK
jgi:uncharacterized membrane protein